MANYRFMYLQEATLGQSSRQAKHLDPLGRAEIPEAIATILDDWDFGQVQDRDGNPCEVLVYDDIGSRLVRLQDDWQTRLQETDTSDNPVRNEFNRYRSLLALADHAARSQGKRIYLVKNPPTLGPIYLRRPQD